MFKAKQFKAVGHFKMAGNANSGRGREKPFSQALRMELLAAGEDHKALRLVARQLIASASEGKLDAIKELIDRTDGKAPQAIIGGDEDDPAIKTEQTVILNLV